MDWNQNKVEELAAVIAKYGLTEIEITEGESRITLKKEPVTVSTSIPSYAVNQVRSESTVSIPEQSSKSNVDFKRITEMKALQDKLQSTKDNSVQKDEPQITIPKKSVAGKKYISSPIAGIFYRQSQPGKPPYVEVGQRVKKGDIVCLVEAMKMINEISSEYDGTVKQFLVENEQFVEYDAPLVVIEEE